ncbi:hypothetical protein QPL79_08260 [Ignisphaera sp. 4213-co]|uniref:Methyltransferase n=1 Tax=Ignisphaera cupida TaxID=3050454 RepID=A0ABD4Z8V0_9CREN|nr:hypothetical protein [Ignisphaera sp. 4213-co]MDK6029353.1 hypothetical protein [Ignisphaera sp. 4213-co]
MIPRERVVLALKHEEPDRVPIDFGATLTTGVHVCVYNELRKTLNLFVKPIKVIDFGQQLAEVEAEILRLFQVDVININRVLDPCAPIEIPFFK